MAGKDPLSGHAESFLARWSRRKQEAHERPAAEVVSAAKPPAPEASAQPPPRVLTDADMPPVESLGADDDYSAFLSPGVSEALRRQALQRLFGSPEHNVGDGLDSYSGDYTQFEPLGDIITADMRHQVERLLDLLSPDASAGQPAGPVEVAQTVEPADGGAALSAAADARPGPAAGEGEPPA